LTRANSSTILFFRGESTIIKRGELHLRGLAAPSSDDEKNKRAPSEGEKKGRIKRKFSMNLAGLAQRSQELGEHVSYIFEGRKITNMQMDRDARRLGNALKKLGVKRGDRVMLQIPSCPEVLQAFQAIWMIGGIVVPINYQFNTEDISFMYEDCGADTVISSPEYLEKVKAAQARLPSVKIFIM
jgi:acyl-CoA synthetase (AMP-forming)/AMP-acid ligase II